MALTLEESAALASDPAFRGRIKMAALKYAEYLLNQPVNTPAINTMRKWAMDTQRSPDQRAQELQPLVVMDTAVQDTGTEIPDAALQATVETVVNDSF
jgi:hypothetical protein